LGGCEARGANALWKRWGGRFRSKRMFCCKEERKKIKSGLEQGGKKRSYKETYKKGRAALRKGKNFDKGKSRIGRLATGGENSFFITR